MFNKIFSKNKNNKTKLSNSSLNPGYDPARLQEEIEKFQKFGQEVNEAIEKNKKENPIGNVLLKSNEQLMDVIKLVIDDEIENLLKIKRKQKEENERAKAKKEENFLEKEEEPPTKEATLKKKKDTDKEEGGILSKLLGIKDAFLEGVFSFLIDIATFGALAWLSNPKNQETIKTALTWTKNVARIINWIANFSIDATFSGLSDMGEALNPESGLKWWERAFKGLVGFGKFFVGFAGISLFFGKFGPLLTLLKTPLRLFRFAKKIPGILSKMKGITGRVVRASKNIFGGIIRGFKNSGIFKGLRKLTIRSLSFVDESLRFVTKSISKIFPKLTKLGGKFKFILKGKGLLKAIPFVGALIDFSVNKFLLGLPTDESIVRAIGAGIGAWIGGIIGGAFSFGFAAPLGAIAGSIAGDQLSKILFRLIKGTPKMGKGGYVDEPTMVIVGEEGGEYIIPEDKLTDTGTKNSFSFAKMLIGSTEAFIGMLGGNIGGVATDIMGDIAPLKRKYGSDKQTVAKRPMTPLSPANKTNLLGLTEDEMRSFKEKLKVINKEFASKGIKQGTDTSASNVISKKEKQADVATEASPTSNAPGGIFGDIAGGAISGGLQRESQRGNFVTRSMGRMLGTENASTMGSTSVTGAKPNFINPLPNGELKSGKGMRWGRMHNGLDLSTTGGEGAGSPVYASASGTVHFAGWGANSNGYNNYGNIVVIDHGNGWTSRYAHLHTLGVRKGDFIKAGETVGIEGSTGLSTGTHLHFEIRKDGSPIDPAFVMGNKGEYSEFEGDMYSLSGSDSSSSASSGPSFTYDDIAKALKTLATSLGLTGKKMKPEDLKPEEDELSKGDGGTLIVNVPFTEINNNNAIVIKPPTTVPKNGSTIQLEQGAFA